MQYYERLKELRKGRAISQQHIAEILGIDKQQYSDYENGIQELPLDYLVVLCMFYRVSSSYILDLPKNLRYPKYWA